MMLVQMYVFSILEINSVIIQLQKLKPTNNLKFIKI